MIAELLIKVLVKLFLSRQGTCGTGGSIRQPPWRHKFFIFFQFYSGGFLFVLGISKLDFLPIPRVDDIFFMLCDQLTVISGLHNLGAIDQ